MRRILIALFVLLPRLALAQTPAVGSQNFADASLSDTVLTLATVETGNTIIAAYLKTSASNRTVTVTDSASSSYSLVASIGTCTAAACIEIYVAHNVAGAGGTVSVTFDQSSTLASYSAQVLEVECPSVCQTDTASSIAESATTSHVCSADSSVIDTSVNVLVYAAAGLAGNLGTDTAGSGYAEGTDSSTSKFFQWRVSDTPLTNERGSWTSTNSVATSCVIVSVKTSTVVTPPPSPPGAGLRRTRFAVLTATPINPNPQPIITTPTVQTTYSTSAASVTVAGTCADNVACTAITVTGTGATTFGPTACTGTATWSCAVTLNTGATVVTVTAADASANTGTDVITITRSASADVTAPVATITTPTSGTTYTASASPLTIGGGATDAVGVVTVEWLNAATGAGDVCSIGPAGTSVSFSCIVILNGGSNAVTITARDQAGNAGTDVLTVTLSVTLNIDQTSLAGGTSGTAYSRQLSATGGAGGNTWTNNGAGTSLNDADSDCSGLTISSAGLVSGTHAGVGLCSFVAKVSDSAMATDTQALTINFVASGAETSHDYYNTIVALPEFYKKWSLRDNVWTGLGNSAGFFHYYTGVGGDTDTFSDPQDATKMTWPATEDSLTSGQQVRFPLNVTSGTILVGWDSWYAPTWRMSACGGVIQPAGGSLTHKQYQLAFDEDGAGAGAITVELRHKYDEASSCAYNAALDHRMYTSGNSNTSAPVSGVTSDLGNSFAPTGEGTITVSSFMQPHSTWIRHIAEIRLNQAAANFTSYNAASGGTVSATPSPGLYHMVTYWVCTETQDCQRMLFQVPIRRQVNGIANGRLTFTGTAGTVVPAGTVLTHPTSGITYTTNATCTISATVVSGNNNCASAGGGTARIKVTATSFSEEGFLDTGGVMTISSPPMGLNSTATAIETIGATIRDGLSALWLELNTSTSHNRASGFVTFTGTNTTIVPKDTAVTRSDGTRYLTNADGTISGGSVTVSATASASYAGPVGNMSASTALTVLSPPTGVDAAATAATAFTGGSYLMGGEAVSYYRNVWALRNYTLPTVPEDDTTIFKKPVR